MERVGQVERDPYEDLYEKPGSEAFARLFSAEEYFMVPESYLNDEGKIATRKSAVQIIQSQYPSTSTNFDVLIPYTAMTYFDRFYSRSDHFPHVITTTHGGRNMRLFTICCLTIAWKHRNKSFVLSSFLSDRNLLYSTEYVLQMELHICRGLEWRMRTLTPFCFVEFFIPFLDLMPDLPSLRPLVHDLIYKSQCDIAFTEYRPSVIAASAILSVSSKMFSPEHSLFQLKILTEDVEPLRLVKEMILKCLNQLAQAPAGSSSEPAPEQTSGSTQPDEGPTPMHRPGKEPATSDEIQPRLVSISEEGDDELKGFERRPGKEPATSDEIQPPLPSISEEGDDEVKEFERRFIELVQQAQIRTRRRAEEQVDQDIELGWKELLEEARNQGKAATSEIEPAEEEAETRVHRPGKEPASASEIQPPLPSISDEGDDEVKDFERRFIELVQEAEIRARRRAEEQVNQDIELGWKELLEEARNQDKAATSHVVEPAEEEAETRVHRPGKEPAATSHVVEPAEEEAETRVHRPGKEPAAEEEIQPASPEKEDLELGWKELLEEAQRRDDNQGTSSEIEMKDLELGRRKLESPKEDERRHACLLQKLTDCCNRIAAICNNIKDMRCNIL